MHKIKKRSAENVIGLTLSGKLTRDEYRELVPYLEERIREFGKIRLLIELSQWDGWTSYATFDDFVFGIKHSFKIERIAFVVKTDLDKQAILLDKPFSPWLGKNFRYFSSKEKKLAWSWVQEGIEHTLPIDCRSEPKLKKARYGAKQRILIAGSSLAGLTMSALLRKRRFSPTIVSSGATPSTSRGLCLVYPSAADVFKSLGIYKKILAESEPFRTYQTYDFRGDLINSISFDSIIQKHGPISAIPYNALTKILAEQIPGERTDVRASIEEINYNKGDVKVIFPDGENAHFDYVIACDEADSKIRNSVFGKIATVYSGYVSWHFKLDRSVCDMTHPSEYWGADRNLSFFPFGDKLYGYASCKFAEVNEIPQKDSVAILKEYFREFGGLVPKILEALEDTTEIKQETVYQYNVHDLTHDRFVLMGDAAHPFHPRSAGGLCFTLESAYMLTELLNRSDSRFFRRPLNAYEQRAQGRFDLLYQLWRHHQLLPYFSMQHRVQVNDLSREVPTEEQLNSFWDSYLSKSF